MIVLIHMLAWWQHQERFALHFVGLSVMTKDNMRKSELCS